MSNLDTIFKVALSGGDLILPLSFPQALSREPKVHWRGGWAWSPQTGLRWSPCPMNSFFTITSWQIDGGTVETVADFLFLGPKITADGDCSHEIKRRLLLGRKVMTNLDSILKSRDITLPTKVRLVKAMVFPVVMYGCESWTLKKAECWRIDAFELWYWRRLLRVPWTERISNQSILKELSPECSLEGLILKLKLQYFGLLMQRADSFEKKPDAGKDWRREKGMTEEEMAGWHHQLDGHEF